MRMWSDGALVAAVRAAFAPLADEVRATQMQAYMKDVAPFLGIPAPDRRRAQQSVWRDLPQPTSAQLCRAAVGLRALPEREFHYAAGELTGRWVRVLEPDRLDTDVRAALLALPWWDTVDLLGSAVVTPMVRAHPHLRAVMWEWNGTDDQWLIRASIQHQRGLGPDTDVRLLLALCRPHVTDRRFFVAKGIGWALRDACRFDVAAVRGFVDEYPDLSAVARREAVKGIAREG